MLKHVDHQLEYPHICVLHHIELKHAMEVNVDELLDHRQYIFHLEDILEYYIDSIPNKIQSNPIKIQIFFFQTIQIKKKGKFFTS